MKRDKSVRQQANDLIHWQEMQKGSIKPNLSMEKTKIQQKTQSLEETGEQTRQFSFPLHLLHCLTCYGIAFQVAIGKREISKPLPSSSMN